MSTREFNTSVNVYEKAQKNLGKSTHPIYRTILIKLIKPSSSGANGTA